jgi:hypothetical protein
MTLKGDATEVIVGKDNEINPEPIDGGNQPTNFAQDSQYFPIEEFLIVFDGSPTTWQLGVRNG